jgi:hypothetical protein
MVVIAIDSAGSQVLYLAISNPHLLVCQFCLVEEKEDDEMTLRLPSRMKEANKRCRGRY